MGLVLAFHLWPETVPGGFVGVDVFFVLSGFLITTRLAVELQTTGRIDVAAFWLRRARRLFPALFLVVVASAAVASLVDRDLLVDIGRQAFGAFTFSTNWIEVSAGTDYFASADAQLLNPLWSLAVEEQFYLVWPAVFSLLAFARVTRRRAAGISLIVAGASAVLMATMLSSAGNATRVYYGTDTHIFGLMIGVTLAYLMADPASRFYRPLWLSSREWVGGAGLALLAVVLTTLGSAARWTYQGGLLSASLVTAAIIATLPGERTVVVELLDLKPMRWIGQRSYGIYLWHWPVLLIVRSALPARAPGAGTDAQTAFVALAVTAAVSAASFRYVERPIHRNGFRATFAHWRGQMVGDRRGQSGPQRSAVRLVPPTVFAMLIALALAAVLTAPELSQAQRSVENGQRMIAAQFDGEPAARTTAAATAAPLSSNGSDEDANPVTQTSHQPTGVARSSDAETSGPAEPNEQDGAPIAPTPSSQIGPVGDSDASPADPTAMAEPTAASEPTAVPVATVDAPSPVQPSAAITIDGTRMVGVGDSVMSGAAPALFERFPGIRITAAASRQWGDAPAIIDTLIARGELRDIVVLNFGTNAGLIDEARIQAARDTFERIGPTRRIIVVTIVGISGWVPQSNANLMQVASAYPNVTVVDWNSAVWADPSLVHNDRTHPNVRGIAVYAGLVASAIG